MIEPSNTELAELPETSLKYIEDLEAEVARLEEVLAAICDEYECDVNAKFTEADLVYPSMQKSKASDMLVIIEARKILNESSAQSLAIQLDIAKKAYIEGYYEGAGYDAWFCDHSETRCTLSEHASVHKPLNEYVRKLRDLK